MSIKAYLITSVLIVLMGVLYYIDKRAREQTKQNFKVETLEGYKETRERLDDAEDTSPSTVDDILEWLSKRQSE